MEFGKIFNLVIKAILVILSLIVIIQLILKLTGHSPTETQLYIVIITILAGHFFISQKEDIKEIKDEVIDIKKQYRELVGGIEAIKLDIREMKTLMKVK